MLLTSMDIDAAHEAEFNRWYNREHLEERVAIDGFLEAPGHLRFVAALELLACFLRPLTVRHVSLVIVPQSGRAILRG